jgi:hypothetical protein
MFALVLLLANPTQQFGMGVLPPAMLFATEAACIEAKTHIRPMLDLPEFDTRMQAEGVTAAMLLCVVVSDHTKDTPGVAPPASAEPAVPAKKKVPIGDQIPVQI